MNIIYVLVGVSIGVLLASHSPSVAHEIEEATLLIIKNIGEMINK
ncbi:hypothetical protein [Aliivibrio salmonicida]|nr:hypothetical protein [Aliivibrio salmonicida]